MQLNYFFHVHLPLVTVLIYIKPVAIHTSLIIDVLNAVNTEYNYSVYKIQGCKANYLRMLNSYHIFIP